MAYPLPGFGRNPFLDDEYDQQLQPPAPSTMTAPWGTSIGSMSKQQAVVFNSSLSASYPAKFDYTYRSTPNKRRPQTPHQAALANAERIVHDPQLWRSFKAMIRERRNDVALPTTNLLTVEYLHRFVEHQFEMEAERIAHEEAKYYEIQRRYESADTYSKSGKEYGDDGRITFQKAAKWLTESFSQLSLNSVEREKEAAALAAAYDAQRASALAMSRRSTMSVTPSSIGSDEEYSDNEDSSASSNNNSFSDSLSSIIKEAAQLAAPTSPLIPKKVKLSQRRRAQWDSSLHEELIDEDEHEMEERFSSKKISTHDTNTTSSSSAATQPRPCLQEREVDNFHRVHYHSNPRPPLPPQGPPPSTPVSPRSSNGGGRRRHNPDQYDNPILPASRGVPLAGILEYGEQDHEAYSPGSSSNPRASTPMSSRRSVPPRLPPVSLQEQTPSWGPRAA